MTAASIPTGTEPLDVALADRFAFIIDVPGLRALGRHDQLSVLTAAAPAPLGGPVRASLAARLAVIRLQAPSTRDGLGTTIGEYVQIAAQKLADAGHPISTRRAVQIANNIAAVSAVLQVSEDDVAPEDAFYMALRHSVPDAAWGHPLDGASLLTIHRAAWEIARLEDGSLKDVFREPDAVRRIALALQVQVCSPAEREQSSRTPMRRSTAQPGSRLPPS